MAASPPRRQAAVRRTFDAGRDILIANRIIDAAGAAQHAPHTVHAFGARPVFEQRKKLGDILVEIGLVTEEQLAKALSAQSPGSKRLGDWLVANTRLTEADRLKALSRRDRIQCVSLARGSSQAAAVATAAERERTPPARTADVPGAGTPPRWRPAIRSHAGAR